MSSTRSCPFFLLLAGVPLIPCQGGTFDIPFNVLVSIVGCHLEYPDTNTRCQNNEFYGLTTYSFNLSVGTPPQLVPVAIDLEHSDVRIDNVTISLDSQGQGQLIENGHCSSASCALQGSC